MLKTLVKLALNAIASFTIIFGLWAFSYMLVLVGKASRYTNAKLNGKPLSFFEYLKVFDIQRQSVAVETDQGTLATVHGVYSDGRIGGLYMIGNKIVDENEMAQSFDEGEYILVSCVNAEHRDFSVNGRSFKRDQNTITDHMTALVPLPWGDFITWAGPGVDRYVGWLHAVHAFFA